MELINKRGRHQQTESQQHTRHCMLFVVWCGLDNPITHMTKTQAQEALSEIYTTIEVKTEEKERIVFSEKYLYAREGTAEKELQQRVSNITRSLGVSFGMSYTVMQKACDIVVELADLNTSDSDDFYELVDSAIPIYNWELMQMYQNDWHIIDESSQGVEINSIARAQMGWYSVITDASHLLIEMLNKNYE